MKYGYKLLGLLLAGTVLVWGLVHAMFGVNLNELKSRLGKPPSAGKGAPQVLVAGVNPAVIQQFDAALKAFKVDEVEKIIEANPGLLSSAKAEVLKKTVAMRTSNIASRQKLFEIFNFLLERSDDVNLCDPVGFKPNALDAAIENLKKSYEEYAKTTDDNTYDQQFFYEGLTQSLIKKGGELKKMANDSEAQRLVAKFGGVVQVSAEEPEAGVGPSSEEKQKPISYHEHPVIRERPGGAKGRRKPSRKPKSQLPQSQKEGSAQQVESVSNELGISGQQEVVPAQVVPQASEATPASPEVLPQNVPQRSPQQNLEAKKVMSPLDQILGAIQKGVTAALKDIPQEIQGSVKNKFDWLSKTARSLFAADKRKQKGIVVIKDGFGQPIFTITRDEIDKSIRKIVLLGIMEHFGYKQPLVHSGYLFVDRQQTILKGKRHAAADGGTLKLAHWLACEDDDPNAEVILKQLTDDYKIHLMPKGMMISEAVALFSAIQRDQKLRNAINDIKFDVEVCNDESIKNEQNPYPKMVIYPASGKAQAQYVLNAIFRIFGQRGGLDITPRFNKKMTSLIYYAQGNGDEKTEDNARFFDEPDMVVYNPTITGNTENYYLQSPEVRRKPAKQQETPISPAEVSPMIAADVGVEQEAISEKVDEIVQEVKPILQKIKKSVRWDPSFDEDVAVQEIVVNVKRGLKKGNRDLGELIIEVSEALMKYPGNKKLTDLKGRLEQAKKEQEDNARRRKIAVQKEFNNLLKYLQNAESKSVEALANEIKYVLALPIGEQERLMLQEALGRLESVIAAPQAKPVQPKVLGDVDQIVEQFKGKIQEKIKASSLGQEAVIPPATTTMEQDIASRVKKFGKQMTERLKSKISAKINDQLERCVRDINVEENKLSEFKLKQENLNRQHQETLQNLASVKRKKDEIKRKIDKLTAKLQAIV